MSALLPPNARPPATQAHHRPTDTPSTRRRAGSGYVPSVLVLAAGLLLGACTTGTPSEPSVTSPGPNPSATPTGAATSAPTSAPDPSATASAAPDPGSSPAPAPAEPEPGPGPGSATVDVVVTFSGWNTATSTVEVGAYAATLVPGTCTLRLTGPAGATAEASAATVADASTVSCDGLAVPRGQLSTGTWSGAVEYTSSQGSGRAPVAPMDIP